MRTVAITLVLAVGSGVICAQSDSAPTPPDDLAAYRDRAADIVKASLRRGRAYENLRDLCQVAPGRLSGSPQAAAAVAWARQRMIDLGLENVRLEPVMVPQWRRGKTARLRVIEPARAVDTYLPITALGGSVPTAVGGLRAEIIEVGTVGALRNRGEEVKGRIVFFNQPMDPAIVHTFQAYGGAVLSRSIGAIEAAKLGAAGALIRSVASSTDDFPHTGAMRYDDAVPRVAAAAVSTAGADRLARLLAEEGRVVVEFELDCSWHEDVLSHNVVGEIVGSKRPDEIVVVGGHLDSWDIGEGAHDDGAGCVQSIEVPRLLLELGLRPRRTIRCVLFMNEENGLRGGTEYRRAHAAEMGKHVLAVESDRGGFVPRGFTSDAAPQGMARLRDIARLLTDVGADRVIAGGGGADISPMKADGVPLVELLPDSQRYFDLHHSARDVFAEVNERELELGAACLAVLCYVAADLEEPLPRNKPR